MECFERNIFFKLFHCSLFSSNSKKAVSKEIFLYSFEAEFNFFVYSIFGFRFTNLGVKNSKFMQISTRVQ